MNLAATDITQDAPAQAWLSKASSIINAMVMSGTTAQRPTSFLWVGRPYFDTTLAAGAGRPIWYNGTIWVLSDGTPA